MKRYLLFLIISIVLFIQCTNKYSQPDIEAKKVEIITVGRYQFKDLNKNNELDPYEDWRLPEEERIQNLISLMTLEEKAGLMFHPNFDIPQDGIVKYDYTEEEIEENKQLLPGRIPAPVAKSYIEEKNFRCFLNNGIAEPNKFAQWSNSIQEIAESSRLGIPIMFSSDPRHGAILGAHVRGEQYFSQWPSKEGQYGIAAARDNNLVKKYGEVTAEEYRAVGLHMLLGPQIDVTTEPRWRRNSGSFSESAELTAELLESFMDGAQGQSVGNEKILVQLKHWPGAGPHKGGQGNWLVYPGNNFEYHLIPWKAGIEKGALAVMGYYNGTYFDTLAVNFSNFISTEVLYNQLHFKGSICTDWFAISRRGALRNDLIGIPLKDRFEISINAGVDQFGGDIYPELIIGLVEDGRIPKNRIDLAVSRILQWHFKLGLFEDPYVDPEAASSIVKSEKNQQLGYQAQLESIVMLSNDGTLPIQNTNEKPNIYISGIDPEIAKEYGNIEVTPEKSDFAILRVNTTNGNNRSTTDEVNIDFPIETLENLNQIIETGVPVIIAFNLDRAHTIIPEEIISNTHATFMVFDILDNALLDVIFGKFNPVGKLPFEVPSSMEAVRNQLEDVPFDSENPIFPFGHGLTYE